MAKICIFTETYFPVVGGGETQARSLAEGLCARGLSVIVLTRRTDTALKRVEKYGAVTVHRLPPSGGQHYKKWGLLVTSLAALVKLRRRYDVIFVSGFRVLGIAAVLISCALGKRCILKADSLGEMSGDFFAAGLAKLHLRPSSFVVRHFLRWRDHLLKRASGFVAISSAVAKELITQGVNPDSVHRIPNSVDTDRFCPVKPFEKLERRQKLGLPETDVILIFTGRLVSYKGLPLLLRTWQAIHKKYARVSLLIVGEGGLDMHNCEAELKAYVASHGLQQNVHFTGGVRNVHEYLQASDLFVFPTEREAFGISLIEAMACGLPVVATSIGGITDILRQGRNGWMVQPDNFLQLYDALDRLIKDQALRHELGREARKTAENQYASYSVNEAYWALFKDAVEQGAR